MTVNVYPTLSGLLWITLSHYWVKEREDEFLRTQKFLQFFVEATLFRHVCRVVNFFFLEMKQFPWINIRTIEAVIISVAKKYNELILKNILKPLLWKYVIHFILIIFIKWLFTQKCYKLQWYVKSLKNFFTTESAMNLKIEASSLQLSDVWVYFSSFYWTLIVKLRWRKFSSLY